MKQFIYLLSFLVVVFTIIKCQPRILDYKEKELSVFTIPHKDYKLKIVHTLSNATIQASIQVRKQRSNNTEELLQSYERYNYVDTMSLINDTIFMLVIRDTASVLGNKPDTMMIKLK